MKAVSFENVSVNFGDTRAVHDVSFSVEEGEILVLLGPSGCGKTTLLRALAGLQSIDSGSIRGAEGILTDGVIEVAPSKRGIGLVFQDLALWPHMTALQHLLFGSGCSPRDKDAVRRAGEILAELGMEQLSNRRPDQLSGGEQQRLAVARALASEPDVLLLDEPLSSVDPLVAADIRRLLKAINQRHKRTMVYVTHSQEEAFELGDRVAVMRSGELMQVGSPEDLALRPGSRFVAEFVGGGVVLDCSRAKDGGVSCALGPVNARPLFDGDACVVIREQNLEVSSGGSAVVTGSIFRGDRFTTLVETGGVKVAARDDCRRAKGDAVHVKLTGDLWFVPADGGGS